jgi:hypothetical protein
MAVAESVQRGRQGRVDAFGTDPRREAGSLEVHGEVVLDAGESQDDGP